MQATTFSLSLRYALWITLFCYLPQLLGNSWGLSGLIICAIGYRWIADYYHYALPNFWLRLIFIIVGFAFLFWHYQLRSTHGFYIGLLLFFVALKCLEIQKERDLQVLVLCNFYIILSVLLVYQTLWVFLYILLAVLANLSLMMKITAPKINVSFVWKRLIQRLFFVLPLSIVLFYLFPRLNAPLWHVPAVVQAKTGFNEEMKLGGLSDLYADDSTVMRIIFRENYKATLYWRGLVLSSYDGYLWKPAERGQSQFSKLPPIGETQTPSYDVLLEPHQKRWLFYQDNPIAANPNLLFSPAEGLVQQDNIIVYQRLAYSLIDRSVVYQSLNATEYALNTYLPLHGNPRIRAWAKQQFAAVNNNIQAYVNAIGRYIHEQTYWYTLSPKDIGIKANVVDHFWFESKRGYCEYYTSAVAILLRSVGIPARVVLGYHGGLWNPIAQYLTVQQNQAHAWLEYWQENIGWTRLDPVTFIAPERIDPAIKKIQAFDVEQDWFSRWRQMGAHLSWTSRAFFLLESAGFFWERWLLFYNQDTQRTLLQKVNLANWDTINLLQACITIGLFLLLCAAIVYFLQNRRETDAVLIEYHRLQQKLQQLGVQTEPPETLVRQLNSLGILQPNLQQLMSMYAKQYERLRLANEQSSDNHESLLRLLKMIRKRIRAC